MVLNCGVGEDSWESLELQGDPVNPKGNQSWIFIGRTDAEAEAPVFWPPDMKNWLTGKDTDSWERLKVSGKGNDRGWDGWMASLTQYTWVWASSGSWWWTGKLGVLQSLGSQRVGHNLATELIKLAFRSMPAQSLNPVWLFLTPWIVACHTPLPIEFSRLEYWNGLPFPPPGDLPDPEIEPMSPMSPAFTGSFCTTEPSRGPKLDQWQISRISYLRYCCLIVVYSWETTRKKLFFFRDGKPGAILW